MSMRLFVFGILVLLCSSAQSQVPESTGGFFDRLKDAVEVITPPPAPAEGEETSWLEKAKELGNSTIKLGKDGVTDLLISGTGANAKMQAILAYLDQKIAGREPSFTNEEIQAFAEEIIPLVEELNGRKFETTPKVAITGNFEMIQILGNDLVPQLEKQSPETSKLIIYANAFISAGLYAPSLLGKYGVLDKTVYVLPENVKAVMEDQKIDEAIDADLMKIIIAHELTHALQGQQIDLNKAILESESPDESLAFQAVVEGHAVYIQNAAARKLGLKEAEQAGRDLLLAPQDEEWLASRVAMANAVRWESIYLGGEDFIKHHEEEGGIEKVWQILNEPPAHTSMIVKPASYSTEKQSAPDYTSLYSDSADILEIHDWEVTGEQMGDFFIESHLGAVPREERKAIMAPLKEGILIRFEGPGIASGAIVAAVLEFSDEAGAKKMLSALDGLNDKDLASAGSSALVEIASQTKIDYDAGKGATGSAIRYVTDTKILGKQTHSVIQVREGNIVAQILYTDVDLKKRTVDAFLRGAIAKQK